MKLVLYLHPSATLGFFALVVFVRTLLVTPLQGAVVSQWGMTRMFRRSAFSCRLVCFYFAHFALFCMLKDRIIRRV